MKQILMNLRRAMNRRHLAEPQAKRNKGAALIVVIICMLFVGIVASIVLSLASSNLSNMSLFRRSAENFYTAENAIDELKASLQEYADTSVRVAYKNWLQQYSYLSHAEQNALFQELFLKDFYDQLTAQIFSSKSQTLVTGGAIAMGVPRDIADLLSSDYNASNIEWDEAPIVTLDEDSVTMTIAIKYTEDDGTVSVISTDLVFTLKSPDFQINTASGLNSSAADYAIISDKYISNNPAVDVNASAGKLTIYGNLYGGGDATGYGYDFANAGAGSAVLLRSDRILTRTTMRISNGAQVSIQGNSALNDNMPTELWARNVLLTNTGSGKTAPQVWFTGDMYLADDLTLNAPESIFEMKGHTSKFYGYGASEDDVENSSAIIINGAGSVLKMTDPDPLYGGIISISGKSFISVPTKFGASASVQGTMIQGESVAFKGEQAAYLLPGECVIGIGHNPLTSAEFDKIKNGDDNVFYSESEATVQPDGSTCYVNIDRSAVNGGINIAEYVQAARPVKVMHVKYDNSTTMVYLYLNFRDSTSATKYFEQYAAFNPALVKDRIQSIVDKNGKGGIKINALALETTGNTLHTNDGAQIDGNVIGATKNSSDPSLVKKQWQFATYFNGLVNNLSKDYIGLGTQTYVTDNIVNMSRVSSLDKTITNHGTGGDQIIVQNLDGSPKERFSRGTYTSTYYLYTGRNITVEQNTAGIIIASGDVTIKNGAEFTGLIIARGKVVFTGTNSACYSDPENILYIMQNCPMVTDYFQVQNVTTGSGTGSEVIASDLITIKYENWQKK